MTVRPPVDAFVDESMRDGLYVLAFALVPAPDRHRHAEALRSWLPEKQPRFHWRAEQPARRLGMVDLIDALDVTAYVVAVHGDCRPRRARALGLTDALWRLPAVQELVIETRQSRPDKEDAATIHAAWRAGADGVRSYRFARPVEEPCLWLADAFAGATAAAIAGRDDRYADLLARRTTTMLI